MGGRGVPCYRDPMSRTLALLLLALVALLGLEGVVDAAPVSPVAARVSAEAHDCCPDAGAAGEDDGEHCCDWDQGACCATGGAVAVPGATAPVVASVRADTPPEVRSAWLASFGARLRGPPPTPPPIL